MKKLLSYVNLFIICLSSFSLGFVSAQGLWLSFDNGCLTGMWQGCVKPEKILWISNEQTVNYTVTSIVQDVIYWATYMVWTVLALVIIYCGLWYIFATRGWGSNVNEYKKWLVSAMIWSLLVWWSYAIVRLIQYVAKW